MTRATSRWSFGFTSVCFGFVALAFFAAPRGAGAVTPCTPQYVQFTENPNDKVLVGCCNANGTWKSGTSTARECLNPANICQQGHCDGTDGSTCNAGSGGNYSNAPGTCVIAGTYCTLGTCSAQQCSSADSVDRCDDGNQCTTDTCLGGSYATPNCSHGYDNNAVCEDGDGNVCTNYACTSGSCSNTTVYSSNTTFCGTTSGATCQPAFCSGVDATCVNQGNPITCSGTIPICKKWVCSWSGQTSNCDKIPKATTYPENNCDDNSHDCNVKRCNANGTCVGKNPDDLPPTDPDYDPSLTTFVCDSNFATPLVDCFGGRCDNRKNCKNENVSDGVPAYVGQTCLTDTDACTNQTCVGTSCNVTSCTGAACGSCATAGTCQDTDPGSGVTCGCVQ